jgi:hypothetical protein
MSVPVECMQPHVGFTSEKDDISMHDDCRMVKQLRTPFVLFRQLELLIRLSSWVNKLDRSEKEDLGLGTFVSQLYNCGIQHVLFCWA